VGTQSSGYTDFQDSELRQTTRGEFADIREKLDLLLQAVNENRQNIAAAPKQADAPSARPAPPPASTTNPPSEFVFTDRGEVRQRIAKNTVAPAAEPNKRPRYSASGQTRVAPQIVRQKVQVEAEPAIQYDVVGAINGRAWLRAQDSAEIIAVTVGEELAQYGRITEITAEGTVVTSSGEAFYVAQAQQ
jgi:hypothetical protein